jgi:hypothetical protein
MCFFFLNSQNIKLAEAIASTATIRALWVNCQGVRNIPKAGISELWNTMAPVILPKARVSLLLETHIMLLNFSGNSVAMGVMIRANTKAGTAYISATSVTDPTNI